MICPRCNRPYDYLTNKRGILPEYYKSNCGMTFLPESHTFYIYNLDWGDIDTICWCSKNSAWQKHCSIEDAYTNIIHSFATWLPFDITEEKLHKLLILI